jgi:hypothetical protein
MLRNQLKERLSQMRLKGLLDAYLRQHNDPSVKDLLILNGPAVKIAGSPGCLRNQEYAAVLALKTLTLMPSVI